MEHWKLSQFSGGWAAKTKPFPRNFEKTEQFQIAAFFIQLRPNRCQKEELDGKLKHKL